MVMIFHCLSLHFNNHTTETKSKKNLFFLCHLIDSSFDFNKNTYCHLNYIRSIFNDTNKRKRKTKKKRIFHVSIERYRSICIFPYIRIFDHANKFATKFSTPDLQFSILIFYT